MTNTLSSYPLGKLDPAGEVDLHDSEEVEAHIANLLSTLYGNSWRREVLTQALRDVSDIYRGDYPGMLQCDTLYHDLRHAFETGVACARMLAGLERLRGAESLPDISADAALTTVLLAIYHDIGLIRKETEPLRWGAEFTPVHEERGVTFMRSYLADTVLAPLAGHADIILLTKLSYRLPTQWQEPWRTLASIIATADILTQSADREYLEKCRNFLFLEFSSFGLAGGKDTPYPDRETLLTKTPAFHETVKRTRLEEEYHHAYRFLDAYFGQKNPYQIEIEKSLVHLQKVLSNHNFAALRRKPEPFIGSTSSEAAPTTGEPAPKSAGAEQRP